MKQFLIGETVTIEDEFTVEGALTTPDTSYKIEIDDPVGTNVVNLQDMTAISTGLLRYNYTPAAGAVCGIYTADTIYVHGGITTKERHRFELVKEID